VLACNRQAAGKLGIIILPQQKTCQGKETLLYIE